MDNSNEIDQLLFELDQNYFDEQFRLDSFGPWFNKEVEKEKLARAGFFYLSKRDHVKCVFCEVEIGGWLRGDNPFVEHKRHSPNCPYINENSVNNQPIEKTKHLLLEELAMLNNLSCSSATETPRHPGYADITKRLKSFFNWPTSLKQTPQELSEAGFFYLGTGDEVKCFYCGGCLCNFESTDLALNEHKKYFFDSCKFIQLTHKNLKSNTYKMENRRPIKATYQQIQHLVQHMKQNESLLNRSLRRDRAASTQAWEDLTETLNNLGGATKDVQGWREAWRNCKHNKKRKPNLANKTDKASTSAINKIYNVDVPQMEISEEFMETTVGSKLELVSTEKINLMDYTNIEFENPNSTLQPTIDTSVSYVLQVVGNTSNSSILDREIMQLQLKIEQLNLETEKCKLELEMKVRQKGIIQKQTELQTIMDEIEKKKSL